MGWIQSFCIYQALRFMVVVTSLPMVIGGTGITTLVLSYPHLAIGSLLIGTSGFFYTIIGLIGTLAAIKKSKYATLSYGITLLLLCGVEVLLGGLFYLNLEDIKQYIDKDLSDGQETSSTHDKTAWDQIQNQYKCCLQSDNQLSCSIDCISALQHEFNAHLASFGTVAILFFFFQLMSACCALSYYNFFMPSYIYKERLSRHPPLSPRQRR